MDPGRLSDALQLGSAISGQRMERHRGPSHPGRRLRPTAPARKLSVVPNRLRLCLVGLAVMLFAASSPADDGFDAAVRKTLAGLDAPRVSPAEAQRLIREEGATVLDTRTEEEFKVSHVAGARFVPFGAWQALFGANLPRHLPPGKPVVIFCTVGWRSGKVAAALTQRGQPRVFNVEGGVLAWRRAGLPLVDAAGAPTRAVHPYNKDWAPYVPKD